MAILKEGSIILKRTGNETIATLEDVIRETKDLAIKSLIDAELAKKETPSGAQAKATKALTDAKSYVDTKVRTDVPMNALFTDTVYTHPNSHPASIIEETSTKRFVTDSDKSDWSSKETTAGAQAKATKSLADSKAYVDDKVKTNVPENAKFTDTIVNIESKAEKTYVDSELAKKETLEGAQTKATKALTDAKIHTDTKVKTNVPLNALFTDTIYTHPEKHPASIITVDSNNRFVTDAEKSNWDSKETVSGAQAKATKALNDSKYYVDSRVKTDVPLGAKFTDTDTIYTHPSTHPYSMITGTPNKLPADGGHSLSATHLLGDDTRGSDYPPSTYMRGGTRYENRAGWQTEFKSIAAIKVPGFKGSYVYMQTHTPWSDSSGGYPIQVVYGSGTPVWRVGTSNTAWSDWEKLNDGGDSATVNGKTVLSNVPAGAKFTDTIYTHPATHDASMIRIDGGLGMIPLDVLMADIQESNKHLYDSIHDSSYNLITDSKADITYVDNKVKTNVPANAKFTDTVTSINGKTGIILKADIEALGISAVGPKGDTGARGPQGLKGDTGDIGPRGIQGIQGEQGIRGLTGAASTVAGPKGDKGDTGPRGLQGVKGDTGERGATGLTGADSTVPGPKGDIGPKGATGLTGDTGAKGDTGARGLQGIQGVQGVIGPKGDTGARGPIGETGAKGDTGAPGLTTRVSLNGNTYNQSGGTITLPALATGSHVHSTNDITDINQSLRTTDKVQFDSIGQGTSSPNFGIDTVGDVRVRSGSKVKMGGTSSTDVGFELEFDEVSNSVNFNFFN